RAPRAVPATDVENRATRNPFPWRKDEEVGVDRWDEQLFTIGPGRIRPAASPKHGSAKRRAGEGAPWLERETDRPTSSPRPPPPGPPRGGPPARGRASRRRSSGRVCGRT